MKTKPLTESELIGELEQILTLLKHNSCPSGTISWDRTSLGTFETIALVNYKNLDGTDNMFAIGDVND